MYRREKETKADTTPKQEIVQSVEKKAEEVKPDTKVAEPKVEEVKTQITTASSDVSGESLFKTCTFVMDQKEKKRL